jgi:signal transduction histidine kinase
VYLGVTSTLQSTLLNQKLDSLAQAAERYSGPIEASIGSNDDVKVVNRRVRAAADASGARVTLLGLTNGSYGLQTYVKYDSTAEVDIRDLDFGVAATAASTGRPARATEAGDAGRIAEAAKPLFYREPSSGKRVVGSVVVFSSQLNEVRKSVDSISRRILAAGGIALLVAILAGWLTARQFSRRFLRMERVAQRVAAGDFSERFERDSRDEIGRLGRALDDMRRQLAELETARKSFIATASHELRTPIFSLGGFLELLEDEDLDEQTRGRFLGQLREQVDRLGKLATDLLDLSRLEAGSLDLRPEHTDIGELARDVAAEFTPALTAHESHLEVRLTTEPVEAVCDPERVAQIMRILIDNALSHTPAGTDVVLAASRRDGRVRLSVTDFGTGIKRAAMPRIFEPFYTSDDAQGSGLGLAIAHELAERMHGELSAESVPGRTTFSLELPV